MDYAWGVVEDVKVIRDNRKRLADELTREIDRLKEAVLGLAGDLESLVKNTEIPAEDEGDDDGSSLLLDNVMNVAWVLKKMCTGESPA